MVDNKRAVSGAREEIKKEINFIPSLLPSHIPHPSSGDLIKNFFLSFSLLGISSIFKLNGLIYYTVEVYKKEKKASVAAVALIILLVA